MNEDDNIDFSALDPTSDLWRWERMITSVVQRASQRIGQSRSIPSQMVAWRAPALAMAAVLALVTWAGAMLSEPSTIPETEPVYLLSQWAARDELPPSTTQIMEAFRGHRDRP
jgi:hypothetical protein